MGRSASTNERDCVAPLGKVRCDINEPRGMVVQSAPKSCVMSVFDSPNTARLDWRLLPLAVVVGAGLVAWGELNAAQRQIDDRVTNLERLTAIEVRLEEVTRLLGGRSVELGR